MKGDHPDTLLMVGNRQAGVFQSLRARIG